MKRRSLWKEIKTGGGTQYTHDLFTEEAVAYIEQERSRPFFLYLAYTIPHAELAAPDEK